MGGILDYAGEEMAGTAIHKNGTPKIATSIADIYHEPSQRWVRVEWKKKIVADSKETLLVWDGGHSPIYYFPLEAVDSALLVAGRQDSGGRQFYDIQSGEEVTMEAAWSYNDPEPERAFLAGYISFEWNKVDHWYEEEEEIFVHPRDPYHRVDSLNSSRHVRVEIDGITVADSTRPVLLFETKLPTRYYFHPEDVNMSFLEASRAMTSCPYKGTASYWSAKIAGKSYRNIAWGYQDPIAESGKIKGMIAFFNEKVDIYIDGIREERPETFWS